ncbi:hypothetical protein [Spirosoma profusum]|nr:hypothetical protein [Spirosoma profusum]
MPTSNRSGGLAIDDFGFLTRPGLFIRLKQQVVSTHLSCYVAGF